MIVSSLNSLSSHYYPSPSTLRSEHYQPLLIDNMLNVKQMAEKTQQGAATETDKPLIN